MKLYADHFFSIGHGHLNKGVPCQDYSLSNYNDEITYAVVSDGCSSGGHTDVGSRVVGLTAASAIEEHWTTTRNAISETVPREIIINQKLGLAAAGAVLNIPQNDLLATCLYAYITQDGGFIHILGDGVVALKYRDGRIDMSNFEWANNTPFYPAYYSDNARGFISCHGGDLEAEKLSEEKSTLELDGSFSDQEKRLYTLKEGVRGITIPISKYSLENELEFISLFSDGVAQIWDFNVKGYVEWKESVKTFMSFKNTGGEFAKRRMGRGIDRMGKKLNQKPFDDISYAVIRVENEASEEVQYETD